MQQKSPVDILTDVVLQDEIQNLIIADVDNNIVLF